MSAKNIYDVTDAGFRQDVLEHKGMVMVDFWAEWCGPCRLLGPIVEKMAERFAGKLKVCKMNIDEQAITPAQYSIRGIPTLLFFYQGKEIDQLVGNQPESSLENKILTLFSDHGIT